MPNKQKPARRRRSRGQTSHLMPTVTTRQTIIVIGSDDYTKMSKVPLLDLLPGIDPNRGYKLKKFKVTSMPVSHTGSLGSLRFGQGGTKWSPDQPSKYIELGTLVLSNSNPRSKVFKPYGRGALGFAEYTTADEAYITIASVGHTSTGVNPIGIPLQFETNWQLERPENYQGKTYTPA